MEKQSILRIRNSERKKEEKKFLNPLLNIEKDEIICKTKKPENLKETHGTSNPWLC